MVEENDKKGFSLQEKKKKKGRKIYLTSNFLPFPVSLNYYTVFPYEPISDTAKNIANHNLHIPDFFLIGKTTCKAAR